MVFKLQLELFPTNPPDLESLNLESSIIESMAPAQGTVIITGSTGSGKSTLLASIIKKIAAR